MLRPSLLLLVVFSTQVICQRFQQNAFNQVPRGNPFGSSFGQSPPPQQTPVRSSGSCPEANGRYPTGQCDAYIECREGVSEEKLCPDGLLFSPASGVFSYPCQYPVDVDCQGRSGLQPAQPTEDCPHQFGYYRLGDERNCKDFMNCVDGRGFKFECPEGLAFDESTLRCNWPDKVASCNAEAYLGFTCPPEPDARSGLGQSEYRFFRSPNDCQHYYICIEGRPRLYNCGEGQAFNELINACDGAENVTGCAVGGFGSPSSSFSQPQTFHSQSQNFQSQPQNFQSQQQSFQSQPLSFQTPPPPRRGSQNRYNFRG